MQQFNSITIEQYNNKKGVTLIELLIAICIFALIVIGFSSIDTFSRYHVITSDRRAKLQNDASYVLEHMAQKISQAIGDVNQAAVDTTSGISGDAAIKVYIDSNTNSMRDSSDNQVAYRFTGSSGNQNVHYQIWYYSNCVGSNCDHPVSASPEVIGKNISSTNFRSSYSSGNDYVEIRITTRWTPDQSVSPDNPALVMKNRIYMPAVSTH